LSEIASRHGDSVPSCSKTQKFYREFIFESAESEES
jgi:hypothetical protein